MPWFSPLYYQQYHETYGYTPEEIYPQILFQGNLPLNEDQLTRGNAWLEANRKVLPRELQDLQMQDIFLTLRTSSQRRTLVCQLSYGQSGISLGEARFIDSTSLQRTDPLPGFHEGYAVGLALQGLGIYPALLRFMVNYIGPLRSSKTLTPGAIVAWKRVGARFCNGRYYLGSPNVKIF